MPAISGVLRGSLLLREAEVQELECQVPVPAWSWPGLPTSTSAKEERHQKLAGRVLVQIKSSTEVGTRLQ